VGTCVLYFILN